MRSMSIWNTIITREIIRARGMTCSCHRQGLTKGVQARFTVENGTVGNKKEAFHTAGLDECEYPEALAASMCSTASIASEASPNRRYSSRHDPQTRRIPWQWFVPDRRRDRIVLRPSA